MIFSRDRILTTHVGSLPRNEKLSDLLLRQEAGETFDPAEMTAEMDKAVTHVVDKQVAAGIDIGNDGEQQRVGFQTYVPQRTLPFQGRDKKQTRFIARVLYWPRAGRRPNSFRPRPLGIDGHALPAPDKTRARGAPGPQQPRSLV